MASKVEKCVRVYVTVNRGHKDCYSPNDNYYQ